MLFNHFPIREDDVSRVSAEYNISNFDTSEMLLPGLEGRQDLIQYQVVIA